MEIVFSGKPLIGGWRQEKSYGYGEEIQRHLSLFLFGEFWIDLGGVTMVEG